MNMHFSGYKPQYPTECDKKSCDRYLNYFFSPMQLILKQQHCHHSSELMSDPMADPCSSWPVGEDISRSSNTLKTKHVLLCPGMVSELVDTESLSNLSSLEKRESSNSDTDGFGNDVRSPSEQDNIASCAEGQHGQSPQRQKDEQTVCQLSGATTQFSPISETILNPKKRKLVLHIDLNNTILVSDAVTNQDPRAALNYYLTTVTWGKISPAGKTISNKDQRWGNRLL